ncbi:MAG: heparan-alpha-glucosaminide N-acetyltransferase domain-containing protein [Capnocytophaga sp.]|nr:heparan-alpha-glucosaminide N-acetyltransferase domain-containing protein [Capnocytophaga sp.]
MKNPAFRLYFIDVMRAFAICMMLQGHFVDGLLAHEYRDLDNPVFSTWLFFRGLTAPVFFTVSGFIFMYLLAKEKEPAKIGWNHIRVTKGIRRGIVLVLTAYALRINWKGLLFNGEIYSNAYMVDVLHCIGLSLLFLIAIYLYSYRRNRYVMPLLLLSATLLLFVIAPVYGSLRYEFLPTFLANYFTQIHGSVFTIFPWFGYAAFGAFVGTLFNLYKDNPHIYRYAIGFSVFFGLLLSFGSQPLFVLLHGFTGWHLFWLHTDYHLFSRLGNVLLVFTVFMLLRNVIMSPMIRSVGQNTLSIYIIHYMTLYGSLIGIGFYRYWHHSLSPYVVIPGALGFVVLNVWLSFRYNQYKPVVAEKYALALAEAKSFVWDSYRLGRIQFNRLKNRILVLLLAYRNR